MAEFIPANANNFKRGRDGQTISYIIIHSVVGSLESCIKTFQNPNRIASAHYIVGYNGRVVQMVSEADTAYHAGNWTINTQSIGIEHDDQTKPYEPRPDALYNASAQLVADLCKRYGIPADRSRIRKHSEVSLKPTACPAALDIDRIVRQAYKILHPTPPPAPPKPDPEWKINLAEIGPHTRGLQQDVSLLNMETGQRVNLYAEGSEVTVEFKTKVHGVDYYITRYSVSKGIANGFRINEFDWEKPVPPPVEIPETPPEDEDEVEETPTTPTPPVNEVPSPSQGLTGLKIIKIVVNFIKKWLRFSK